MMTINGNRVSNGKDNDSVGISRANKKINSFEPAIVLNDNNNNKKVEVCFEENKISSLSSSSSSSSSSKKRNSFHEEKKINPLKLIPKLCNQFYHLGWVSGTGGGLSILQDGKVYCAPSGVQKERIQPEDMFILNEDGKIILKRPKNPKLSVSECLSLFMVAFKSRQVNCCIHIHSIYANLVTAYYSDRNDEIDKIKQETNKTKRIYKEFKISNQEMIKGIRKGSTNETFQYNDTLIVPIIDNVLHERDLADSMEDAIIKYPITNAILVRNHGCYIWGKSWDQAKTMAECYDYLFRLKIEAIKCGFDWMLNE